MSNIESLVETLKCPVCWSFPRSKSAYTCLDCGYVVCQSCGDQIKVRGLVMCPMCRSPKLVITKYMERLLSVMREMASVSCQYESNGCQAVELVSRIERHEERCNKRTVGCPAGHWTGGCKWQGVWDGALQKHLREKKCLETLQVAKSGETICSQVMDHARSSTLDCRGTRHWKPLFVALEIDDKIEGVYINISRAPNGLWTLMPRCYAPNHVKSRISVLLCVSSAREGGKTLSPRGSVSYSGPVSSHHLSNQRALASGHSLFLTDAQIRFMKKERILFNYSLVLTVA